MKLEENKAARSGDLGRPEQIFPKTKDPLVRIYFDRNNNRKELRVLIVMFEDYSDDLSPQFTT